MYFRILPVTKHLLIINIIIFLATQFRQEFMISHFALFFPTSQFFAPWQPLTHMFMHYGFAHIFFNMYSLVMFGSAVEGAMGSRKFLVFYLFSGIGAFMLHLLVMYLMVPLPELNYIPMLGASGAIYGVFIGYAMMYPNSIITLIFPPVSLKAKWMMLIFAGIELTIGLGVNSDGVAHFAHLGGMLFGALLILFWKKTGRIWLRDKWI